VFHERKLNFYLQHRTVEWIGDALGRNLQFPNYKYILDKLKKSVDENAEIVNVTFLMTHLGQVEV